MKATRRRQLVIALKKVMAEVGYDRASVVAVADAAGLSPSLVHHNFANKEAMLEALLRQLTEDLRARMAPATTVDRALEAALGLGPAADPTAARVWVAIFAQSLHRPDLRRRVRVALARYRRALVRVGAADDEAILLLALTVGMLLLGTIDADLLRGRASSLARRVELSSGR